MKAATASLIFVSSATIISIHAAREGGDFCTSQPVAVVDISIHAAREGGDEAADRPESWIRFQSTPPVKAATRAHALSLGDAAHFNPRRP